MQEALLVVLKIFPILTLLGMGVWLRASAFVSRDVVQGIKKITMNIAVPALLFTTFSGTQLEPQILLLSFMVFLACTLEFGLGFVFQKLQKSSNPFYPSLFTTYLNGPVGFPLYIAFFGQENFFRLAILDIGNAVFLFTVLTVFLDTVRCNMQSFPRKKLSHYLKTLFRSPLPVSIFVGIFFSLTGLGRLMADHPLGIALYESIALVASAAIPLILIVVGYDLPFDFSHFNRVVTGIALRLIMMLTLAYLINRFVIVQWLQLDALYTAALYTMFILPPPFFIPLSIIGECEHKRFVLDFVSLHLFISLGAFLILMLFL